jgi:hypothetical protein
MATTGAHCRVRHCARSSSPFWTHSCFVLRFFTCSRFYFACFSSSGSQSLTMIATGLAALPLGSGGQFFWMDCPVNEPTRRALLSTRSRSLECFGLRARPSILLLARGFLPSRARRGRPSLPPDVAGEVLLRLPSYADMCFGAVCRSWRASAVQHGSPPSLPIYHASSSLTAASRRASGPSVCPASTSRRIAHGRHAAARRSRASPLPLPLRLPTTTSLSEPCRERVCDEYDVHEIGQRSLEDEPELSTLSVSRLAVCSSPRSSARRGTARQVRAVPARGGVVVGVRAQPVEAAQGHGRAPGRALHRRPQREPPRRDVRRGR